MRALLTQIRRKLTVVGFRLGQPELLDGLILILVFTGAWLIALHQGGARAEGAWLGTPFLLAAAVLHGTALAIRQDRGFRPILGALAALPLVIWLGLDAIAFAPNRGAALQGLTLALLGASALWMTAHHARQLWSQMLACILIIGPASLVASGAYDNDGGQVRAMLGLQPDALYTGRFASSLGSPAGCAAVMTLGLIPALATALHIRLALWLRLTAGYFAILLTIGLWQTQHGWALLAAALGIAYTGWSLRRRTAREWLDLRAVALVFIYAAWSVGDFAVGLWRTDATGAQPLGAGAIQGLLEHPVFGGGAQSYLLGFEKIRPESWQTDPTSSGSILLDTLAEHGALGTLCIGLPLAALLVSLLRAGLRVPDLPKGVTSTIMQRVQLRRTLLASGAGGIFAAVLILCISYSGGQVGVLILMAALAGSLLRAGYRSEASPIIWPAPIRPLIAVTVLTIPLALTPILLAPLAAEMRSEGAIERVSLLSPTLFDGGQLLTAEDEARLRQAIDRLRQALELNGREAETRAWLAQALALLHRQEPTALDLRTEALTQARLAVEQAPRLAFPKLVMGSILLGSFDAKEREAGLAAIREAQAIAPQSRATVLRLAQALGQSGASVAEIRPVLEQASRVAPGQSQILQRLNLLSEPGTPAPQ